jgi:hypothetical protein
VIEKERARSKATQFVTRARETIKEQLGKDLNTGRQSNTIRGSTLEIDHETMFMATQRQTQYGLRIGGQMLLLQELRQEELVLIRIEERVRV